MPDKAALVVVTLRLPPEQLARLDALIPAMQQSPELGVFGKVSRADVARLALAEGLRILEARYNAQPPLPMEGSG